MNTKLSVIQSQCLYKLGLALAEARREIIDLVPDNAHRVAALFHLEEVSVCASTGITGVQTPETTTQKEIPNATTKKTGTKKEKNSKKT